ncbi:MAG TPA: IS91 family transposase [Terriglobales bacterium]|nr:IS91 family transposase [Terriglobales bacterium]
MSRPTVEVADILRAQGDRFVERNRSWLGFQRLSVLRAITRCRTAALGGHIDACPHCGYQEAISYNSCRNRHCPKCQAQARQRWLAARDRELLGVPYFHVVFTLPHELNLLCQYNPEVLYSLLFQASAATLLEVAADPKHLGAEIGFLSILHTWGQNLLLHPHVHCAIPAGGFSPDHTQWVRPRYTFFLPVKVLSRVFRGKFVAGLRRAYRQKKLCFHGPIAALEDPKRFASFLRTVFRQDWVVYAKPAFGGPLQVLRYLGRYTHRVAISNHRLVAFDGEHVVFRWKDYAHDNKQRKMRLNAMEFLRRFVQHVLPRGFVRIRQYGFLANRCRTVRLAQARQLLAITTKAPEPYTETASNPTKRCPRCGAAMKIGPNLTGSELTTRCNFFDSS